MAQVVPSIKAFVPSLVPRHVSRPAQYTQHFDLIFGVLYLFFSHRLRLKVDHEYTAPIHEASEVTVLRIQNLARVPNRTVDDPIVTEQEIEHSTEESQIPEIEDKFSLPYN